MKKGEIKMDYKEEYQKALERAKKGLPIDEVFPELKESEDERIRKSIILLLQRGGYMSPEDKTKAFAWLEKHKEQKPTSNTSGCLNCAKWEKCKGGLTPCSGWKLKTEEQKHVEWSDSAAKEMFIKALERAVEQTKKGYELTDCDKHSWWEDFKAYSIIKPAEWSEEDEKMLNGIIERGNSEIPKGECGLTSNQVAWLKTRFKSLRPSWKPSEEQMEALRKASDLLVSDLNSLYNDLTKQM